MAIHSTNSNKTNNLLNTQKTTTCDFGNPDPVLSKHKKVTGLNWLMGSQPYLLDNWILNDNNKPAIGTPLHIVTT